MGAGFPSGDRRSCIGCAHLVPVDASYRYRCGALPGLIGLGAEPHERTVGCFEAAPTNTQGEP